MELSRRDKILKLCVEHFIKTATPVGSQTLLEAYDIAYSSATIRAEMNALELDGFLEKPHTSAGRVPSSKGYRYFVEHLRNRDVDQEMKYKIQQLLDEKTHTIEEVIRESCEILAHMTNLASVVLGPNANDEQLVSIQVIPISQNTATAIFITNQGYVENKTFIIPEGTSVKDVEQCVTILNKRLIGTPIADVITKMESLKPLLSDYIIEHSVIYQAFTEAFLHYAKDRLSLYGKESLFDQPEFANDAAKLKKIITLLDHPEMLRSLDVQDNGVTINIGGESDENDISIITTKVRVPGQKDGTIALVGPKRMDYDKVVAALEYVSATLEKYFEKEGDA